MATNSLHINRDIILASKKQYLQQRQQATPTEAVLALAQMQHRPRSILNYASDGRRIRVIAQVTRTEIYDPVSAALRCVAEGADAIAFFTDHTIYTEDLDDLLMIARAMRSVPVIYQNYVMNEYGVMASRGADASALVIYASLLDPAALRNVVGMTMRWKMSALVQVNTEAEAEAALMLSPHAICFGDHLSSNVQHSVALMNAVADSALYNVRRVIMNTLHSLREVELALAAPTDAIIVSEELFKIEKTARTLRNLVDDAQLSR